MNCGTVVVLDVCVCGGGGVSQQLQLQFTVPEERERALFC